MCSTTIRTTFTTRARSTYVRLAASLLPYVFPFNGPPSVKYVSSIEIKCVSSIIQIGNKRTTWESGEGAIDYGTDMLRSVGLYCWMEWPLRLEAGGAWPATPNEAILRQREGTPPLSVVLTLSGAFDRLQRLVCLPAERPVRP